MRKPPSLETTPDEIEETLRAMIVSGALVPGAKVNEVRLAGELGISRTPLREVLRGLEAEGFVRAEHNRGFWTAALNAQVRELYPIVSTLERLAVADGWLLLKTRVQRLEELSEAFGAKKASSKQIARRDEEFHAELVSLTSNETLRLMLVSLKRRIKRYEAVYMEQRSLVSVSHSHHVRIVSSIRRGDLTGAIAALEENWRFGMESLLTALSTRAS